MFQLHWVLVTVTIGSAACSCVQSPLIGQYGLCAHMNFCLDKLQQPKSTFSHRCTDVCVQYLILSKCDQKPVWELCDKRDTWAQIIKTHTWWLNNGKWSFSHTHTRTHTHTCTHKHVSVLTQARQSNYGQCIPVPLCLISPDWFKQDIASLSSSPSQWT